MTDGMRTAARWAALAALASTCALSLAACEGNGSPSHEPAAAAPAQGSADLMGTPDGGPSTRTPEYIPPPGAAAEADGAPAPGYPPPEPPPQGRYAYGPRYAYPQRAPSAGPIEVIAMAPIPNPPEAPRRAHYGRTYTHRYHRHGWWGPVYAGRGHVARHHHHHHIRVGAHAAGPVHAVAAPRPAATKPAHHLATAPAPQFAKPKPPHAKGPDTATVAAASGGSSNTTANTTADGNATGAAGPEGARYDALTAALATVLGHEASLNVPAKFDAANPADVTLTVPGDFAQTVRTEAAKQNLSDDAASANLEATLAGDGYAITPVESQAQALTAGAPTVFHWKVTPQGATRGPLHADVRATLLGSGRSLALGSVKAGDGSATGRVIGIGLLLLIAAVLIGWVWRTRRPAPTGAVKPRKTY